jgi:triacylglycerol lipase
MQAVDIAHAACRLARLAGGQLKSAVAKVDADVWREFGYVSLSAYSLAMPRRERIAARRDDGRPPVVLVHGLGGNRGCFTPLRMFLRAVGFARVYSFGYESQAIPEVSASLVEFVHEILETTGESQVDIVAHSLGGVVSRYAIQRLGLARQTRTLVTLASPHQGTFVARYLNTPQVNALRPESELLRELNEGGLRGLGVRFVAMYSDRDIYVLPKEHMTHPDAENIFLPGLSHSQFLIAPSVLREVVGHLQSGWLVTADAPAN